MDKWSVVIPTLWNSDFLHEQLTEYIGSDRIGQIVLIDNSNQYEDFYDGLLPKLTLVQPKENLYVNPSWNFGVNISKYHNVVIANDDILWDIELLSYLTDDILDEYGIIGQEKKNYTELDLYKLKKQNDSPEFYNLNGKRPNAWGCLLFFKKKHWKPIPEQIKIWYGDDWLINKSGLKTSKMTGIKIGGELNASESDELKPIRMKDQVVYGTL